MPRRRGGQLPRFRDAAEIEARIDAYFQSCAGVPMREEDTGKAVLDKRGKPVMAGERPATLTGLALALGFNTRTDMLRYRGRAECEAAILRGRSRLEQYAEERLYDKECGSGARFVLENGGLNAPPEDGDGADAAVMDEISARMARGTEDA